MEITVKVQILVNEDKCSRYCTFLQWRCGWKCGLFVKNLEEDLTFAALRCSQCKEAK
jgi:hypothetical protein